MKWCLSLLLCFLASACQYRDPVSYQEVTVVPVYESIACGSKNTVDVSETVIDHY